MNRITQGFILIISSCLLLANNYPNIVGSLASLGFIIANTMGLIIYCKKNGG